MRHKNEYKQMDLIVYWTTILILVILNFLSAIVITPLLIFTSGYVFLAVAMLAMFFGYIFTMLVKNIEPLQGHHHMIAVLFVPAFAVLNLLVISTSVSGTARSLGLAAEQHALSISLVYVICFLVPYFLNTFSRKR